MTTESSRDRRHDRFPCLDGCRAVAALMVVVSHTAARAGVTVSDSPLAPYLDMLGTLGVSIFFVLSGFLLYRPFVRANLAGEPMPSLSTYARSRFLRIFPAYWVAVIFYVYVLKVSDPSTNSMNPLQLFGLGQVYSPGKVFAGIPAAWTLCVELSFYVALPIFALGVRALVLRARGVPGRLTGEVVAVLAFYCLGVFFRWATFATEPHRLPTLQWLPALADWFAVGMMLAVASAWRSVGGRLVRPLRLLAEHPFVSLLLAAEIVWLTVQLHMPTGFGANVSGGDRMARNLFFGAIGLLVLVPFVINPAGRSGAHRALKSTPLRLAGLASYSIYLYHQLVLRKTVEVVGHTDKTPGFWVMLPIVLVGTLAVAALSYRFVELPAMKLKTRIDKGIAASKAAAGGQAVAGDIRAQPATTAVHTAPEPTAVSGR